ncbi:protein MTSS 2 isoform X6 [Gorilla gorilla gorilla]|uniref:protein MTSS 2 isoform X6 n=1 Tax=Gorilla gorilla gorilla TaxID=9595 RepID=UPI002445A763|nr:protein MTSS 2 isoform X3 [Gorilla gorilla gorilla]
MRQKEVGPDHSKRFKPDIGHDLLTCGGKTGEASPGMMPRTDSPLPMTQSSYPIWEDFNSKATKLHSQLRTTVLAAVAFLDAFQKVADMATNTRGATRDIGSALTRMCMRHRSIETKLRQFTNALLESLINPLQERIEDWKKAANQLDKDHAKEYKRARHEIKKKSSDTLKLQKKARKAQGHWKEPLQAKEKRGRRSVHEGGAWGTVPLGPPGPLARDESRATAGERRPAAPAGQCPAGRQRHVPAAGGDGEAGRAPGADRGAGPLLHLHHLPAACGEWRADHAGRDHPPAGHHRRLGGADSRTPQTASRQRAGNQRPKGLGLQLVLPDPTLITQQLQLPEVQHVQKSSSSASSEASETCQSVSECSSPTSDWSKVGSHEQPSGATLQRRKDRVELLRDTEPGPASGGTLGPSGEEAPRPRMSPATIAAKHGEEVSPAASDLAMVLTRGLSLEHQKSSRDSLQYSSGYSTQTTTPSCSEDTIPSQGSDYDCYSVNGDADSEGPPEFDKSSTIPRNSNIAQNYRRLIQTKRPASTAGLPTAGLPTATGLPSGAPPGVATIRRTPSTKPTVRRALSSAGPIPIRPPIVPVKTPTVPDSPGYMGPTRAGSEECVFYTDETASPLAPDLAKASPKRLSLPNTAWGSPSPEAAGYPGAGAEDEQQQLAANRHSLVEKLGELVAGAHALGEGQFPFPTALSATPTEETPTPPPAATSDPPAEDMLVAIRRGVRLRRTVTNDRSAPRIL